MTPNRYESSLPSCRRASRSNGVTRTAVHVRLPSTVDGPAAHQPRQVLVHDALDRLRIVALNVQRPDALAARLASLQQRLDRDVEDLRSLLEAEVAVERDRVPVLRVDVEQHVRAAVLRRSFGCATQEPAAESRPSRGGVDPEIRHVDGRRAVVAVARQQVADRVPILLGEQRDAVVHHPLDLRPLHIGRILGIRQVRKLRLEPLDERHEQIDVCEFCVADVHEPTPE